MAVGKQTAGSWILMTSREASSPATFGSPCLWWVNGWKVIPLFTAPTDLVVNPQSLPRVTPTASVRSTIEFRWWCSLRLARYPEKWGGKIGPAWVAPSSNVCSRLEALDANLSQTRFFSPFRTDMEHIQLLVLWCLNMPDSCTILLWECEHLTNRYTLATSREYYCGCRSNVQNIMKHTEFYTIPYMNAAGEIQRKLQSSPNWHCKTEYYKEVYLNFRTYLRITSIVSYRGARKWSGLLKRS